MQPRSVIKTLLFLFVCASVVYLIAGGRGEQPTEHMGKDGARDDAPGMTPTFIAYYFHRDFRCQTCLRLEALCREAIQNGYAKELEEGTFVWRVVNVDEPENEHFIDRFGLFAQSLVVEEVTDGQPGRWKNLEEIWDLMDDREQFMAYVKREVDRFLEESR
jgi:hypothetical protein